MIPHLDQLSFWIGFIFASLMILLLKFLLPFSKQIQTILKEKKKNINRHITDNVKEQYLSNLYIQVQGLHLASPLFMLDEILIVPKLMAPPARVSPDETRYADDFVSGIIPYLPTWPEVAATFKAPTLTISEALSGNSDIVITGKPGTGKSVALAYMASLLSHNSKGSGLPEDTIPFLVDLADINLLAIGDKDPIDLIINNIRTSYPMGDANRNPLFVRDQFSLGHALLLLDGTDELTEGTLTPTIDFIRSIKQNYPRTRIITTGNPENLSGLVTLNFIPFSIAYWDQPDRQRFLAKWGENWFQTVPVESSDQSEIFKVHQLLINNWINSIDSNCSPFELTLLTWESYAGDITGGNVLDSINSHIKRLIPVDVPMQSIELLAFHSMLSGTTYFSMSQVREWIKSLQIDESIPHIKEGLNFPEDQGKINIENKNLKNSVQAKSVITQLVENGLLSTHPNDRLKFTHPIFCGFLAANKFDDQTVESMINSPNWVGKFIALNYYTAVHDAKSMVDKFLLIPDDLMERNLLIAASWLRDAVIESDWRIPFMERLGSLIQISGRPLGFRGQILAAMIQGNDEGIRVLLRHLMQSEDLDLLRLCFLGSAMLKDIKSVDMIANFLVHENPLIVQTACLALVTIGTRSAMDFVANALLHGEKETRKSAAEALANHPTEGHAILREAIEFEDFLVRWAVVYGLGRINEFWAKDLISKSRLEDEQWIVRNAADEILEAKLHTASHIPKRLLPTSECPWLISFASKKGLGITPGKPATEILLMALEEGSEEEQLASLDYLRISNSMDIFPVFYEKMSGSNPVLREAIFRTIWEMAARGVKIPDPRVFEVSKEC